MPQKNHIVIFSHGFGVKKDDRGLFTDIADSLKNIKPVMFDFNDIDEEKNLVTVRPFSSQVKTLNAKIAEARAENSEAVLDIVCHSQGAIAVALAKPAGIRKIIMIAPPVNSSTDRMVKVFQARPGTEINTQGVSRLSRADGSMTIVPPEYWAEREDVDPLKLYGELAHMTELTIINANQDDVLDGGEFLDLKNVEIINLDGDHGFHGYAREKLLEVIASKIA